MALSTISPFFSNTTTPYTFDDFKMAIAAELKEKSRTNASWLEEQISSVRRKAWQ